MNLKLNLALLATLLFAALASAEEGALAIVPLNTKPGSEYQSAARLYQGVSSIARDAKSGRLWAALRNGDEIRIGDNRLVFHVEAREKDPPGTPTHWIKTARGEAAVSALNYGIVVVGASNRPQIITARAREWLAVYFPHAKSGALPQRTPSLAQTTDRLNGGFPHAADRRPRQAPFAGAGD